MTNPSERPDWLPHDEYPFDLRSLDLPSGSVCYTDEGDGPTLLFVHAGLWSFIWRDVMTELSSEFRTIAIDFPGFGLSPSATSDQTIADLSSVLAEFVAHLDLTAVTLVAHDLGGPVGIAAAANDPDRYEALVLSNTFAWEPEQRSLRMMLKTMGSSPLEGFSARTGLLLKMASGRFGVGRHLGPAGRRAFLGPFHDRSRIRRFHRLLGSAGSSPEHMAFVEEATRGPLNHLPVLTIFGGRNDPWKFQRRHADTFPNHEGHILRKRYHFPMTEDQGRFAELIREWSKQRISA